MKEENWMELQEEAPLAAAACLHYFQDRHLNWKSKMLEPDAILSYLQTKGFEITVSTFGIPNRNDWYCEVFYGDKLIKHERDFTSYELAATEAIVTAFLELEKSFVS